MYITINGNKYENAKRVQTAQRVTYICSDLPEELTAEGIIGEYRDDGFLLREMAAGGYARQLARSGVLTLTNEPEVQPADEPSAEELIDILLGGEDT